MCDASADITQRYERAVHDALTSDFVYVYRRRMVLSCTRNGRVSHQAAGCKPRIVGHLPLRPSGPTQFALPRRRETLESKSPSIVRGGGCEDGRSKSPKFQELNTLRYVNFIVKQGAKLCYKPAHRNRYVLHSIQLAYQPTRQICSSVTTRSTFSVLLLMR
jgi:hypothetical protein